MTAPVRVIIPDRTAPVSGRLTPTEWLAWVRAQVLNGTGISAEALQRVSVADREPIRLVYGEQRLGAQILNVVPTEAGGLQYVVVQLLWAIGTLSQLVKLQYNDEDIPASWPAQIHYDGSQTSANGTLVSAMAAQGVSYGDTLEGYAYSVVLMPVSAFTGALNFTAIVRGLRLYDPRLDSTMPGGSGAHRLATPSTWTYSTNPSLAAANYLYSSAYGCGKTVDWASVMTAANANDALVGGEKRRILDGVTIPGMSRCTEVADTLRTYAGCVYLPGPNGIRLVPDAPAASVASYSHAAGQIAALARLEKRDMGNVPTVVEVIWTDRASEPWRDSSAIAQLPGVGSTRPYRLQQIRLPGIHRYSQAYREAVERLNKLTTSDLTLVLDVFDIGIAHELGDVITVADHPAGLSNKLVRIADAPEPLERGTWRLPCTEYDPAAYSDAVVTAPSYPDTGLTNPAQPPTTPTGLAYAFSANGVELTWNRNAELTVVEYELRTGATWAAGQPLIGTLPTLTAGTTFTWPPRPAGTHKVWIKARTTIGVESVAAASVDVVVSAPVLATLNGSLSGTSYVLDWALASTSQPIAFYRVRRAGVVIAENNATRFSALVDWAGSVTFTVAGVDIAGNEGAQLSEVINITGPTAVASFTATTIVNTVIFYWQPPVSQLPIVAYRMKKGATWAGGTSIGNKAGDQTFTTWLESESGEFTYWIAPVDSAGNEGPPTSLAVRVNAPANFKLAAQWNSDFSGTKTNAIVSLGALYAPVITNETFQQHFTNRSWASPQDQMNAGFEIYIQPSATSGGYVETFDAGAVLAAALVTVVHTGGVLDGAVTLLPTLEVSANGVSWSVLGNVWEAFASNFRYVRVTLGFTAAGGDDLYQVTALTVKLALQTELDAGNKAAADFVAGVCAVTFNKPFIDVESIVVTPLTTARREWAVEFADVPSPTGFSVRMWDPTTGNLLATDFSWQATGVV